MPFVIAMITINLVQKPQNGGIPAIERSNIKKIAANFLKYFKRTIKNKPLSFIAYKLTIKTYNAKIAIV